MSASEEEALEPSSSGAGRLVREGGSKLFLGGLSWDTSEEKLREHFETYGELVEVVVMRDRGTGRPRGFGFVTYKDPDAADRVVKDVHIVDGRQIDTKKSVPQESKPKARKIFVGGLAPETSEEVFRDYFSQYGPIAEVQIMQDHMSGRSRGFGFVTFEEDSSAERAFAAGPMHEISGKQVEVKPATPKGTGPQPSTRIAAGRGRPSGEYEPTPMMPFPGALPTTPPFSPYGMYAGYPGRPGMVPPPYGMPQYPQYMLMQPSMPGFPPATPAYGAYPQPYSGPGRGQGGGAMPIPFSRPSPGQQQQQQQQQQGGYYYPSPSPSPPSQSTQKSGQGRNKVDSASSLDQHAERFQKMRLHD